MCLLMLPCVDHELKIKPVPLVKLWQETKINETLREKLA